MKTTIIYLFSFMLIIGFGACKKTEHDPNPSDQTNPNRSYIVQVTSAGWKRISPSLIRFDIPLKDLTEYYMLQGGVAVALSMDNEATYDILPTNFSGIAFSVNYAIGGISIYAEDPLADAGVTVPIPQGNFVAKIILSATDFFDYNGVYRGPAF